MQFAFLKEICGTHGRQRAIPISYMISPGNETSARNEITTLKKGDARNERLVLGDSYRSFFLSSSRSFEF